MNVRRNHLAELPEPIPDNPVAEQRIAVLRRLAERLPLLAARVQIHVVGKGGTLLRLCEDTPRPSTDYDCDTSTRWNDTAQAQAVRQALRNTPNVNDLVITEPRNRNHPVLRRLVWAQPSPRPNHAEDPDPASRTYERTDGLRPLRMARRRDDGQVLQNQVNADQMLMGIMECLETDPVIALHTYPERRLGFQIDRTNQTVAMGLQANNENPFHALVRLPQHRSAELADLALASRAPIWHAIGQRASPSDLDGQRKLRIGLINHLLGRDEIPNPNEHMDQNLVQARLLGIKRRVPRRRPQTPPQLGTGQDKEPDR